MKHAVVFTKGPGGGEQFAADVAQNAAAGRRPQRVTECTDGGQLRYAGVWR